jgi:hypothetical protein
VYNILKSIGFKYRKTNDGRKFIKETGDILAAGINFLITFQNLKISGDERPEFYLNETWVNQFHSKIYICMNYREREALEFLQGAGLFCARRFSKKKKALFLRASGFFVHVHKCKIPIIIRK